MWGKINDGGQAYPVADSYCPNGQVMYGTPGMTLRDHFAGLARNALSHNNPAHARAGENQSTEKGN